MTDQDKTSRDSADDTMADNYSPDESTAPDRISDHLDSALSGFDDDEDYSAIDNDPFGSPDVTESEEDDWTLRIPQDSDLGLEQEQYDWDDDLSPAEAHNELPDDKVDIPSSVESPDDANEKPIQADIARVMNSIASKQNPVTSGGETETAKPAGRATPAAPETNSRWPLGMIAVAIVALFLLAAGGYGIIEQRSAAREEIRQLRAALAVAANQEDVNASRDALRDADERIAELQQAVDSLALEKLRLEDTVAGLEHQIAAVQQQGGAAVNETAPVPDATTATVGRVPAAKKASAQSSGKTSPSGVASIGWFVNLGSYSQRTMAQDWVDKLKPSAGQALVTEGLSSGKTIYRVRIVGLPDRDVAQRVANELQKEFHLGKPWVGRN